MVHQDDGATAGREPAERVREFVPLPGRTADARAAFHACLDELIRFLGADVDRERAEHPEWTGEQAARSAVRKTLAARPRLAEEAFGPLLTAAVLDPNPSFSRHFVEPSLYAFGRRRVRLALLDRLRTGTDQERAGAARAWYWTALPLRRQPRGRARDEDTADVVAAWHEAALREFVANEHLDVRRCILPGLPLHPKAYPSHLHALVGTAVAIARAHPDAYLRHRVEVQIHG
ncbi:hypothetical protein [Streptomyces sp. NPDC048521]|uniref:hypothetical protein n=1 Tax=Streptomyces sp. NPDC048521 TaxID=3365566 RepID=UPI0037208DF8